MKMLLIILLVQHAVISARAGLVTYVNNMTLEIDDHMGEGNEIHTGRGSRFEAMLGPDTYVRMRNRATIVLVSDALDNTVLRLVRGSTIVDAKKIDDDIPIRVLVGDLEFSIRKDGLYLFEDNRITVLDGELRLENSVKSSSTIRLRKHHRLIRFDGNGTFQRGTPGRHRRHRKAATCKVEPPAVRTTDARARVQKRLGTRYPVPLLAHVLFWRMPFSNCVRTPNTPRGLVGPHHKQWTRHDH